jgi:hypothetical protein
VEGAGDVDPIAGAALDDRDRLGVDAPCGVDRGACVAEDAGASADVVIYAVVVQREREPPQQRFPAILRPQPATAKHGRPPTRV